jgi:hypothetical protein
MKYLLTYLAQTVTALQRHAITYFHIVYWFGLYQKCKISLFMLNLSITTCFSIIQKAEAGM